VELAAIRSPGRCLLLATRRVVSPKFVCNTGTARRGEISAREAWDMYRARENGSAEPATAYGLQCGVRHGRYASEWQQRLCASFDPTSSRGWAQSAGWLSLIRKILRELAAMVWKRSGGSSMFAGGSRLTASAKWRPLPTPRFAGGADGCCVCSAGRAQHAARRQHAGHVVQFTSRQTHDEMKRGGALEEKACVLPVEVRLHLHPCRRCAKAGGRFWRRLDGHAALCQGLPSTLPRSFWNAVLS
jgi:hypothetical protein